MIIIKILIAILVFSAIVLFHELGHFLLAKANGIQVNEFSLGLGPTLIGFTKGETKYSIKLLPFGGACMMEGEDDASDNPRAFPNKSVWARISVVFAGPFFNFIMAFVFAYILVCMNGTLLPNISVMDGYPAQEAGIESGDRLVKINHFYLDSYNDLLVYLQFHQGEEAVITYEHDGKEYQTTLTPKFSEEEQRYLYGFASDGTMTHGNAISNIKHAFFESRYYVYLTFQSLRMLFTGKVGVNDLSGPVGIVSTVGDSYESAVESDGARGGIEILFVWIVFLSVNLGVMNLLPIPALDGGRLLFLIIEAIRRKRIDPQKEGFVHLVGIVLLLGLMVLVMFNDIRKLFM